ncbi:MAG TPA: hypothetical protein PLY36_11140, partial [Spirochaetota bacterium]|nr:hypothetical protein [Spirochaetota bacterium]
MDRVDREKELILKIEFLERENRDLKNLLKSKDTEPAGSAENSTGLNTIIGRDELLNINSADYL